MRKFLCFFGFHVWAYDDSTHCHCTCCPVRQVANVDLDFNTIDWFRVD